MRILASATAVIALLAAPASALAQQAPVPQYGETDKDKTPAQIAADKAARQAYQRSLGNIPDKGPTDPWGGVRSEPAPKPVAKSAPAKRIKTGSAAK